MTADVSAPGAAAPIHGPEASGRESRRRQLHAVAAALLRALPGDAATWTSLDTAAGTAEVLSHPAAWSGSETDADLASDKAAARRVVAVAADHSVVGSRLTELVGLGQRPRRLSDVITPERWSGSLLGGPVGPGHELIVLTSRPSPRAARWWSVHRAAGDFTDAERDVAVLLQPMLGLLDPGLGAPAALAGPGAAGRGWDTGGGHLTGREVEVLRLVSTGLTAEAVARAMGIRAATVRKHLQNAYRKLGCHDRLVAVQHAEDMHLITRARPRHEQRLGGVRADPPGDHVRN